MNKIITLILAFAVIGLAAYLILGKPSGTSNGTTVNQTEGNQLIENQNVDATNQNGGVDTLNNTGSGDVIVEASNVNSTCKNNRQKNYGQLNYQGNTGPMCKSSTATKIKRKNCDKKKVTIHNNLCVMEWESKFKTWRVRIIK